MPASIPNRHVAVGDFGSDTSVDVIDGPTEAREPGGCVCEALLHRSRPCPLVVVHPGN